ncbi:hypothetical protein CCH79_00012906, partial [Gambusia affinis]
TAAVIQVVLTAARVIVGLVYFQDCPQQPNIPKYLLGIALFPLLAALLTKDAARPQERPSAVWVFTVYQPNYDPFAADGLYCNKTLYTFAFWNAVLETFGFVAILAKLCKGLVNRAQLELSEQPDLEKGSPLRVNGRPSSDSNCWNRLEASVEPVTANAHQTVRDCPQQPNIPNYLLGLALIPLLMIPFVTLPGDVWVFSVYQPNYDPSAADGFYCNKTLYTFAFWNAVFETFGFGVLLAKFCKGMLCYVIMSPVDRDFYG